MSENKRMCDIPTDNRPYEKCFAKGAEVLSDQELLAVILRTGTKDKNVYELSEQILQKNGKTDILSIMHYTKEELMRISGIGKVKAIQILCIGELSKRMARKKAGKLLDFSSPESIADYYMEDLRHLEKEQLVIIYLNTKCGMIKDEIITVGTINQSLISPREIFVQALKCDAVNIIVLHNHPSGNPTPSNDDIYVTKKIHEAGKIIGINVLDHIIIGNKAYSSLKKLGII